MKKILSLIFAFTLFIYNVSFAGTLEMDNMEYASDATAQAAYVSNGGDGSEIVSNGGFDSATTGWTVHSTYGTISSATGGYSGNGLKSERLNSDYSICYQAVTLEIGKTYRLRGWYKAVSLTNCRIYVGTGIDQEQNLDSGNKTETDWTEFTGTFVATATTHYINIASSKASGTNGQYNMYDSISLKEVGTLYSYSEGTIKTQGSYSLKAVATTGAVNKTLTRTATIGDLTGVKNLKFDIRSSRTGSSIKLGIVDAGATSEITPNIITADTFQTVNWDLSGVADANKNAITAIVVTVTNADSANTFYIDNFEIAQAIDVFGWVN